MSLADTMSSSFFVPVILHHSSPMRFMSSDLVPLSQPSGIFPLTSDVVDGWPPLKPKPFGIATQPTLTGPCSIPRTSRQQLSIVRASSLLNVPEIQPSCTVHWNSIISSKLRTQLYDLFIRVYLIHWLLLCNAGSDYHSGAD